mmetsp:Transcript_10526/g.21198  ORF Transcript_10526/g.21198 Transcript_10526/m.21198 type:complete len:608 (-) Transcript_10526:1053-2876(-)
MEPNHIQDVEDDLWTPYPRQRRSPSHSRSRSRSRSRSISGGSRSGSRSDSRSRSPVHGIRGDGSRRRGRGGSGGGHTLRRTNRILVRDMLDVNEPYRDQPGKEDLEAFFSEFGKVSYLRIPFDRQTRKVRGYVFVEFAEWGDAQKCFRALNEENPVAIFRGRRLHAEWSYGKPNRFKPQREDPEYQEFIERKEFARSMRRSAANELILAAQWGAGGGGDGSVRNTAPPATLEACGYDETSGWYYDPKTFYYIVNLEEGTFYDGSTRTYLRYHAEQRAYVAYDPSKDQETEQQETKQEEKKANVEEVGPANAQAATNQEQTPLGGETKASVSTMAFKRPRNALSGPRQGKVSKVSADLQRWNQRQMELRQEDSDEEPLRNLLSTSEAPRVAPLASKSDPVLSHGDNASDVTEQIRAASENDLLVPPTETTTESKREQEEKEVVSYLDVAALDQSKERPSAQVEASTGAQNEPSPGNICFLCRRKFKSNELLLRHVELSDLHKKNLEISRNAGDRQYRDRAAERRETYGVDEEAMEELHRQKEKKRDMKAKRSGKAQEPIVAEVKEDPLGSSNMGNKLLRAMGWKQGQGLGKCDSFRCSLKALLSYVLV